MSSDEEKGEKLKRACKNTSGTQEMWYELALFYLLSYSGNKAGNADNPYTFFTHQGVISSV